MPDRLWSPRKLFDMAGLLYALAARHVSEPLDADSREAAAAVIVPTHCAQMRDGAAPEYLTASGLHSAALREFRDVQSGVAWWQLTHPARRAMLAALQLVLVASADDLDLLWAELGGELDVERVIREGVSAVSVFDRDDPLLAVLGGGGVSPMGGVEALGLAGVEPRDIRPVADES